MSKTEHPQRVIEVRTSMWERIANPVSFKIGVKEYQVGTLADARQVIAAAGASMQVKFG